MYFGRSLTGLNWVVSVVDVGSFAGMVTGLLAGIYGQSRIYFVPRHAGGCAREGGGFFKQQKWGMNQTDVVI